MISLDIKRTKETDHTGMNGWGSAVFSHLCPSWTGTWTQPLKVEEFFCWCLMGTEWPWASAGMVGEGVINPSESVADCSHCSSDSLSAGQMLIVFIIGSYEKARLYPVSIPASRSHGFALLLSPQCLLSVFNPQLVSPLLTFQEISLF